MKFDDLDARLRVFETLHDSYVLPEIHIVVRLDGRGFTRNTKELWDLEAPFDVRFRDAMLTTTEHLLDCGFKVVVGYTQSDEISLLLDRADDTYHRKTRKLLSVLAGEASAAFSLAFGRHAVFDARISQLPTERLVVDYFRWRHEDAHRNALKAHCYWLLRAQGHTAGKAGAALSGRSIADKNELLFRHGVNFNDLPAWQKRGAIVHWAEVEKQATNRKTGEAVSVRRRLRVRNLELPLGDDYCAYIQRFLSQGPAGGS